MRPHFPRGSRFPRGFSLVELLVVCGIIAVLISLLLPTLGKIREEARRVQCLGNLRTLGTAFLLYTQHNEDRFPRPGTGQPEDWVKWPDPSQGVIWPYTGASKANAAQLYTCPSDDPATHTRGYPFSYSVNFNICAYPGAPSPPYVSESINRNQVRHADQCILLIEESQQTIDDGCWAWQPKLGDGFNVPSVRHDRWNRELAADPANPTVGRTNVGFVDGHAEWIPRADAFVDRYWDPNAQ